jgi:type I restriction enzyme S subunit
MTEWKIHKLGELCSSVIDHRGKTPLKLGGNWVSSGYRALSAKNIKTGQIVQEETIRFVNDSLYKKWMKEEIERGCIIITSEAPFGEVYYWDSDEKIVLSQRLFGLKISKEYDSKFIYYYMRTHNFQEELRGRATGTTVIGLRQPELLKCHISLPPLEEQRRIAGILSAIDDKIENNRRINTNLELQAQALYKQWFVDNRSDDWEVGKVSDYYDITIGKTPPRKEKQWFSNNPKDSVWVSISDMGSCGAYISDSSEYLTTKAVDKFNIKVVPKNTVLLSFKLTVGRVAISDGAMTTNEAIAHFNTLNDYLTEYTYLALKAYNFANLGSTSSIATAVNSKIIKSILWVMPNDNVLRDFHNMVAPIFTQIKNNIRENETLATLRDTLLPKLMNGEIKM